jgi:hypothetical protein
MQPPTPVTCSLLFKSLKALCFKYLGSSLGCKADDCLVVFFCVAGDCSDQPHGSLAVQVVRPQREGRQRMYTAAEVRHTTTSKLVQTTMVLHGKKSPKGPGGNVSLQCMRAGRGDHRATYGSACTKTDMSRCNPMSLWLPCGLLGFYEPNCCSGI